MFKQPSFGEIEVTLEQPARSAEPDDSFRVVILGDFTGRANRAPSGRGEGLARRSAVEIDRDNFDDVMAKLPVELSLPVSDDDGSRFTIRFRELEDFHPDRLLENVELFQALREKRRQLKDPRTFSDAASDMRSWADAEPDSQMAAPPQPSQPSPAADAQPGGNLLDQILRDSHEERPVAAPPQKFDDLQSMLRKVVKPYLVSGDEGEQKRLVARIDEAIGSLMRAILGHPDFKALEAGWRALYFLTRNVETGSDLKLYLLDVSKAELAADLASFDDLTRTGLYGLLVEQSVNTPGADPWSVIVGDYSFEPTREEAETLGRMARVAREAGAPFISSASPRACGWDSFAEPPDPRDSKTNPEDDDARSWDALRKLDAAEYVGLALPRFLLRLPYGAETEPIAQFDFEEMPGAPSHEDYLWGNPAYACAYLLARAFEEYGWDFKPGVVLDIENLPLHTYKEDGQHRVKPCAETLMTERAAESIIERGIMVLASIKDRDSVRLLRFQSISDPPSPLSGRWE